MHAIPQLADVATWKQRFRVAQTTTQLASVNPARGLVTSNRSGVFQLYAWDAISGKLNQLTHSPKGKPYGILSPDGSFVYYLDDQDGNELGHYVRIPYAGGAPVDITPAMPPYASMGFDLSRNGELAGVNTADQDGFHIHVIDLRGERPGMSRQLCQFPGITFGPVLASDASRIAIASSERASGKLQFSILVLDTAEGSQVAELWDGPETSLSLFDFSLVPGDPRLLLSTNRSGMQRPLIWNPETGERTDLVLPSIQGDIEIWSWSADARLVLLCNLRQAVQQLYLYDLEHHQVQPIQHPSGTYDGAYFASDTELFAHWTSSAQAQQVIALDLHGNQTRVLFPAVGAPPAEAWRSVQFASSDGQQIQAWLATPPGVGPFPTILETHGGPTSVQTDGYSPGAQMWVDHGFAYISVNYRGSTTFGKEFEEKIWGDLGTWEIEDIVAARNWLVEQRIADPDAILLTGWSYGGYLTLMGAGMHPNLWAGGMAGIAIADWVTQWEDTAPTLRGYQAALLGGSPAQNPEQYRRSSPITYADQVRAPLLVIQGSNDTRCPARPMRDYEDRLRAQGKQIEIEWFEAGHGSYETELQIRHHEVMLRFAYRVLG